MAEINMALPGNPGWNDNNLGVKEDPKSSEWLFVSVASEFGELATVNVSRSDFLRLAAAIEASDPEE